MFKQSRVCDQVEGVRPEREGRYGAVLAPGEALRCFPLREPGVRPAVQAADGIEVDSDVAGHNAQHVMVDLHLNDHALRCLGERMTAYHARQMSTTLGLVVDDPVLDTVPIQQ
jgi:hypothetical protein